SLSSQASASTPREAASQPPFMPGFADEKPGFFRLFVASRQQFPEARHKDSYKINIHSVKVLTIVKTLTRVPLGITSVLGGFHVESRHGVTRIASDRYVCLVVPAACVGGGKNKLC